eukprot:2959756-Rhodomonas_salina.1
MSGADAACPGAQGPDRENDADMQDVRFVATSASTFGVSPPVQRRVRLPHSSRATVVRCP